MRETLVGRGSVSAPRRIRRAPRTDSWRRGAGGLPPELADKLNTLPEVGDATGIQIGFSRINTKSAILTVVDPKLVGSVFDLQFVSGKPNDRTSDGILVSKTRADSDKLVMGNTIDVTLIDGKSHGLTVQGIYTKKEMAGAYNSSNALYAASGADTLHFAVYATKAPGVSDPAARAATLLTARSIVRQVRWSGQT